MSCLQSTKMTYPTKKLGEVCKIQKGKKPELFDTQTATRLPYLEAKFMRGTKEAKFAEKGDKNSVLVNTTDLIIICDGSKSGDVFSGFEGVLSSTMGRVDFDEKQGEKKYLEAFLKLNFDLFNSSKKGAAIPHLDFTIFNNLEIPLPPLAEQRKIVAKLERVLVKISEAKKLRREAQEAAKNLLPAELHKIFTTPHHTHTNKLEYVGMSSGGKNGWEEKELGKICEINPKKAEVKNEQDNLSVSFVPMKAVDEFSQEITSFDERKLGEVRKGYTYFRDGDVLFAKITPCMENGKVAIAQNLKNGIGFGTTEFHVIRPKEGVLSEWIYAIIRHPEFRDIAKTKMTGSAGQKRVPVHFLETFKIPLPPLAEQKKIVGRLDSLSEKIGKIKNLQSATQNDFAALEQSVLQQAFVGHNHSTQDAP